MRRTYLPFAAAILTFPLMAHANIIWEFNQSDGGSSLQATVTTTGEVGDLATDGFFDILTLDSLSYTGGPAPFDPTALSSEYGAQIYWDAIGGLGSAAYAEGYPDFNQFEGIATEYVRLSSTEDGEKPTQVVYQNEELYGGVSPGYYTPLTSPVPEPSTIALLMVGLLGVGGYATRRRRNSNHS